MGMNKFWEWFIDPLIDDGSKEVEQFNKTSPQKAKLFRPQTFEQYIGQERAKNILTSYIKGTKEREKIFPHVLIHGSAGCGKTTLARIIANELNVGFAETIASEIKIFEDVENKIYDSKNGVVFADEIHSLDRDTCESIYTVMEDFTYEGESIPEFTFIGATTELGEILKNRRPFYDRFKIIIELENYKPEEIAQIIKQYQTFTFPKDNLNSQVYEIIGKNSRNTPRTGIRLLEATIYLNGDINQALKNFGIVEDGYTEKDLKVINYLKEEGSVGLQGLASYLNTSTENYLYNIEPYLLMNGLISRKPRGRKITEKGIKKVNDFQNTPILI